MSDYEKHIDKIRKYFEEHKAERYPFENALLNEKDEYVKSLYFRMLCTLVRYTGEPSEMQVLYIRRLIAGSHAENEFEDYMKMALDLDTEDIDEFISVFKEDDLKYYFCIDGAILLSVIKGADKNYELLAEFIEMLGLTSNELKYLTAVAKATIIQSSELFDEAKRYTSDTTENLSMYHYVCGFYSGAITHTPSKIHIYSKDKSCVNISDYETLKAKKVIIENITADLHDDVVFEGCAEVVIKNCKFSGNKYRFEFFNVGKIVVENCRISDFSNRFTFLRDCNELIVSQNHFVNCGYTEESDFRNGFGGVIYSDGEQLTTIILEKNTLQNCYIARETQKRYMGCTGIFIYSGGYNIELLQVIDNQFIGCRCKNNGNYTEAYISARAKQVVNENNVCNGAITRIFEK